MDRWDQEYTMCCTSAVLSVSIDNKSRLIKCSPSRVFFKGGCWVALLFTSFLICNASAWQHVLHQRFQLPNPVPRVGDITHKWYITPSERIYFMMTYEMPSLNRWSPDITSHPCSMMALKSRRVPAVVVAWFSGRAMTASVHPGRAQNSRGRLLTARYVTTTRTNFVHSLLMKK